MINAGMVQVEAVGFDRHIIYSEGRISAETCLHVPRQTLEWIRCHESDAMAARMHAYVWEHYLERVTVTHPRTWWDAVKIRFAPAWYLRRWPPDMVTVSLDCVEALTKKRLPDAESAVGVRYNVLAWRAESCETCE